MKTIHRPIGYFLLFAISAEILIELGKRALIESKFGTVPDYLLISFAVFIICTVLAAALYGCAIANWDVDRLILRHIPHDAQKGEIVQATVTLHIKIKNDRIIYIS